MSKAIKKNFDFHSLFLPYVRSFIFKFYAHIIQCSCCFISQWKRIVKANKKTKNSRKGISRYASMKNPFLSDLCWLGQAILHGYYHIHVIHFYIPNRHNFKFWAVAVWTKSSSSSNSNSRRKTFLISFLWAILILINNISRFSTQKCVPYSNAGIHFHPITGTY